MTVRATGINPQMLRWAREQSGYSVDEISERRGVPSRRVVEWEQGRSHPTWQQLEHLAHKDYHRSTSFFFRDSPPIETSTDAEFRRLPGEMLEDLLPDTRYAVRQARERQNHLISLLGDRGVGEKFILRDLQDAANFDAPDGLAQDVRDYLGIGIGKQKSWRDEDLALKQWRDSVVNAGVWVFKRSFQQEDISGFCLNHSWFPVIYINNGQSRTRQIFTLFHELAHLLFDFNHLGRVDENHYLEALSGINRNIEVACNRFAGEFLVPDSDFDRFVPVLEPEDDWVADVAKSYSVSREVILRKLLDRGRLDGNRYREIVERWRSELQPRDEDGGNYYLTQATYLGTKYLRTAFLAHDSGRIDDEQLATVLDVKVSSLGGLEKYAWE